MVGSWGSEPRLTSTFVKELFRNKFVVIIGDSNQRAVYKDLVGLLQKDEMLPDRDFRMKGEHSFMNDSLIEGGTKGQMNNGTSYREVRQYRTNVHLVRFYFVTRCYNQYVESIMTDLMDAPSPDVVFMNSCLWDMTRYGRKAITEYKENMELLFCRFAKVLPVHCLMVWTTTLPISKLARGGFLVKEVEYRNEMLRMDVLEANYYARNIVVNHGYDVLDLHFWLRRRLDWRCRDGIHWCPAAHRHISHLLLMHVSQAWGVEFPSIPFPPFGGAEPMPHAQQRNNEIPRLLERTAQLLTSENCPPAGGQRAGHTVAAASQRPAPYPLMARRLGPMPNRCNGNFQTPFNPNSSRLGGAPMQFNNCTGSPPYFNNQGPQNLYSSFAQKNFNQGSFSSNNFNQGNNRGSNGFNGNNRNESAFWSDDPEQSGFQGMAPFQASVPAEFYQTWSSYGDDSFSGPQRHTYHNGRPYNNNHY